MTYDDVDIDTRYRYRYRMIRDLLSMFVIYIAITSLRRGIFLKFRPREREISKFGLPKASSFRVPWVSALLLQVLPCALPVDAAPAWLHRARPCSRALVAITKLLELGSSGC